MPVRRMAAELDQTRLVRIERQRELLQPFLHRVPEALGIGLVLETIAFAASMKLQSENKQVPIGLES